MLANLQPFLISEMDYRRQRITEGIAEGNRRKNARRSGRAGRPHRPAFLIR